MKTDCIDLLLIKKYFITIHYDYFAKYLLRKEYDSELIYEDRFWIKPTILEVRESRDNNIAAFLTDELEGSEPYHKLLKTCDKKLGGVEMTIKSKQNASTINLR